MEKIKEYDESFMDIDKFQDNVRHILGEMEKKQLGLTEQQFLLEEALTFIKRKRKLKWNKSEMADKQGHFFDTIMPKIYKKSKKMFEGKEDE